MFRVSVGSRCRPIRRPSTLAALAEYASRGNMKLSEAMLKISSPMPAAALERSLREVLKEALRDATRRKREGDGDAR